MAMVAKGEGQNPRGLALWYPADARDQQGRRMWKVSTYLTRGSGDECRLSL
jgi:hypothetical protein